MKKKAHIHYCNRTLVLAPGYIGLCVSEKAYKKELKRLKIDETNPWITYQGGATTHTFVNAKLGVCSIVCFDKKNNKYSLETTYAILAHEATHVWQKLKAYLGEDNPSDEFEAYSMQNICEELFKGYKKAR